MPAYLIVIICVLGVYTFFCLVIGFVILSTSKAINNKEHAINVLMAQKFDLLVSLGMYMEENGVILPDNIKEALNIQAHDDLHNDLKIINTYERLSVKTLLMKTVDTLFYIAETNGLGKSTKYRTIKTTINDIDIQHRKEIAIYNSLVFGYNYWIRFFIFKPIAVIFRIKKKETMY